MSQPTVRGFFKQRIDDARDASLYVRSLWGMMRLSRRRHEIETELGDAHRRIGDAAEKARVGDELPAMQGVRDARAALTTAQADLERHKGELAGAQEAQIQQATHHNQIVAPIEADGGRLGQEASAAASAQTSAQKQVGQIEQEIKRIEAMLSAAGQGKPSPQPAPQLQKQLLDLQQTLDLARENLATASETHQRAQAAAQRKQAELNGAKEARKQALAACEEETRRCHSVIKETETTIGKCEVALGAAHDELGKAALEANLSGAGIDEPLGQARSLMQRMAMIGEQSSQTRAQASANRGAAIRSAAALAVIALAIGLVWIVAAKLIGSGQPILAQSTTQPAPASPEVSGALEKAILALPELNAANCKVTGKLSVDQATPRAGSARIIDLSLPVEIGASDQGKPLPGIALIRVLADPQDRILNSEITLPDPELAELEALGRN